MVHLAMLIVFNVHAIITIIESDVSVYASLIVGAGFKPAPTIFSLLR